MTSSTTTAAVNRFGLGAMPGELALAGDARGWLQAQLRSKPDMAVFANLPGSLEIIQRQTEYRLQRRRAQSQVGNRQVGSRLDGSRSVDPADPAMPAMQAGADGDPIERTPLQQAIRRDAMTDIALRYRIAATTSAPFVERLVHFWSNHFAISIDKNSARLLAAPMEREAIRPHVLGDFADLLTAVETHPGMLLYLDNAASVGDASMLAQLVERRGAKRRLGLNENLAREILELHTLGVDGGYAQQDVVELAKAITGWGTPVRRDLQNGRASNGMTSGATASAGATSAFVFRPGAHEPGARSVLGKRYAEAGEAQGRAILRDLALHPATARHLSLKLARHFVSDTPPPKLIERMATAYLRSGGSLPALYRAMIDDDAAWSADARKFKTPEDFVVSAMRAGAMQIERRPLVLMRLLQQLGQPAFTPRSPAGFPDTAADWASGDALRKRMQASGVLAEQIASTRKPVELAIEVLGAGAVQGTFAELLRRAGSQQEGFALLFSSPAFQWRV